jgi:hypothetical protein
MRYYVCEETIREKEEESTWNEIKGLNNNSYMMIVQIAYQGHINENEYVNIMEGADDGWL